MQKGRRKTVYVIAVILLAAAIAGNLIQLPYYVTQPGSADRLAPMVKVKNGYKESGSFRLVTVLEGRANVWQFLRAKMDFNPYTQVLKADQVAYPDESKTEMNVRQLNYMKTSQIASTYVAYKAAGKKPKLEHRGVLIVNVHSKMPAARVLRAGDIIVSANGRTVRTIKDLQNALKNAKAGERIDLTVNRNGKRLDVETETAPFPKDWLPAGTDHKVGLGILQAEAIDLDAAPPVRFNTGGIGGPSAGLMMSLEIYEQLTPEDLSKGYDICGTGTIDFNGNVGPIGGIKQKVVAADRAGAEIFFAPVAKHEADDARAAARDIGSDMKIVPVKTFDDAVRYLRSLKPKN